MPGPQLPPLWQHLDQGTFCRLVFSSCFLRRLAWWLATGAGYVAIKHCAMQGLVFPAPVNPRYSLASIPGGRLLTAAGVTTTFNNYYEFTTQKTVSSRVGPAAITAMQARTLAPGFRPIFYISIRDHGLARLKLCCRACHRWTGRASLAGR